MGLLATNIVSGNSGHIADSNHAYAKLDNSCYDVKADYGALGDDSADDSVAIQAAITACGAAGGGIVYFPPGKYRINTPLSLNGADITLRGASVSKYFSGPPLNTASKIAPGTSFPAGTNRGLIEHTSAAVPCSIQALGLDGSPSGTKYGTSVHGIVMSNITGQHQWTLRDVSVHGFSGDGLNTDNMRTTKIESCTFMNNGGWGLNLRKTPSDSWFLDLFIAYNKSGGVIIGDQTVSGTGGTQLGFTNCRLERNGGTPAMAIDAAGYVTNVNAPGLRIERGSRITAVNCRTAANTGDGFIVDASGITTGDGAAAIYNIDFMGCNVVMDGTGDPVGALPDRAGITFKGSSGLAYYPKYWSIIGCSVYSDNLGSASHNAPKYGYWIEESRFGMVIPTRSSAATANYNLVGNLFKTEILDADGLGYYMIPRLTTATRPVTNLANYGTSGAALTPVCWDATLNKAIYYDGTNWRDAMGTVV